METSQATPLFPPDPDYTPYTAESFRVAMGLFPLDLKDWIEPDPKMVLELAEKERLLRERYDEVFIVQPEAYAGSQEVLDLLAAHLPARFPSVYHRAGDVLENAVTGQCWNLAASDLHPLDLAGRLVQEDLCMMKKDPDTDSYRLVGASLCFPTRWSLAEKMGLPLGMIHQPTAGYKEHLDSTMDRFFARMKIDKPVWRLNWGIVDDPTLFQSSGHSQGGFRSDITAENAGEKLWLRVERQTLRRLPRSQDILFTIRVYVKPLTHLLAQPERAAAMARALRGMPDSWLLYKSLSAFLDALLGWLERVAVEARS
jgi:hypothetical protein